MAGDTQEPEIPAGTQAGDGVEPKKPKHQFPKSQVGKLWEEFGNPEEPINMMPGGTYNSAGGKPGEPTYWDAAKSVITGGSKTSPTSVSLAEVHKVPCARDALLVGIGMGFGAGGLSAVLVGKYLLFQMLLASLLLTYTRSACLVDRRKLGSWVLRRILRCDISILSEQKTV